MFFYIMACMGSRKACRVKLNLVKLSTLSSEVHPENLFKFGANSGIWQMRFPKVKRHNIVLLISAKLSVFNYRKPKKNHYKDLAVEVAATNKDIALSKIWSVVF